jgi:hypothetical protein
LFVNGALVNGSAAGQVTGGFNPDAQRWFAEAVVALRVGKNTVRFERDSYFPHIDKLLLMPRPGAWATRSPDVIALERGLRPELVARVAEKLASLKPNETRSVEIDLPDRPETLFAPAEKAAVKAMDNDIAALEKSRPALPRAMAVSEGKPADLKVHMRGNYLTLGAQCSRGFPEVLQAGAKAAIPPDHSGRLELAKWMTGSNHPLTARVFVNRVWRWHFGRGIVPSVDNFGTLGDRPSNQRLLDWLATTFVADGWSLKSLHRRIMLSNTYQMSSRFDAKAAASDPENRMMWRMDRRRLEAEEIRDSLLAIGGTLDTTMGGTLLKFKDREYVTSTANADPVNYMSNRRSVYLPVIRSALYDVFTAFDFGDPTVMNGDRPTTTVAPQALFLMNSALVLEQTRAMAKMLLAKSDLDDSGRILMAYETCFSRPPAPAEAARAIETLKRLDAAYRAEKDEESRRLRCWQSLCKTLVGSSEFIYVD